MEQAVPHNVLAKHYSERPTGPSPKWSSKQGRGPLGGKKLTVGLPLWRRIVAVALPKYALEDDRTVLPVDEAARLVTALAENAGQTARWPDAGRSVPGRAVPALPARRPGHQQEVSDGERATRPGC